MRAIRCAKRCLIVEVEGSEQRSTNSLGVIMQIARKHDPVELRESKSAEESAKIWLGRKSAFGAMGQINDYMCLDGTIPVSSLPFVCAHRRDVERIRAGRGNVFHAGDGNMHPLILFDANKPGDLETCEASVPNSAALCRGGRLPDRRAWRGDRKARPYGRSVFARGSRGADGGEGCVRSGLAAKPGKGVSSIRIGTAQSRAGGGVTVPPIPAAVRWPFGRRSP